MYQTERRVSLNGITHYILGKRINRGGMAEIYLAKQIGGDGFERLVAIKKILPHYQDDDQFVTMFRDEANIGKRLNHANLVQVLDFQQISGSPAIVMEFVNGSDLRSILHTCEKAGRKIMPVPMALSIIIEAARGLHYAHTRVDESTQKPLGIVHRDISPQNILVSYDAETKVTDFGIADADQKMNETKAGVIKGKYSYMSPEQVSGKNVDARSDVFALGIILWEILTLKRLFLGETEPQTIKLVMECKIERNIKDYNPEVDEALEAIINKALSKNIKDRYQSAQDFEKELSHYVNKRYPEFTKSDTSKFLKNLMREKREKTELNIKEALSQTKSRPQFEGSFPSASASKHVTGNKSIEIDAPSIKSNPAAVSLHEAESGNIKIKIDQDFRSNVTKSHPNSYTNPNRNLNRTRTNLKLKQKEPLSGKTLVSKFGIPLAIALFFTISMYKFISDSTDLAAKQKAEIILQTVPSRVKAKLQGKSLFSGKYKATPIKLKIPKGKYNLDISREGYTSQRIIVDARQASKPINTTIALKPTPNAMAFLKVVNTGRKPIEFNLNDGMEVGQTPATIEGLIYGKNYSILLNVPNDNTTSITRCQFRVTGRSFRKPTTLLVNADSRGISCKIRN